MANAVTSGQRRDTANLSAFCTHLQTELGAQAKVAGGAVVIDMNSPVNSERFKEMTRAGTIHLANSPQFRRLCSTHGMETEKPRTEEQEREKIILVKTRKR